MILPQTMIEIVKNGGGLIIDLNKNNLLPQTVMDLAAHASVSGSKIIIRNPRFLLPPTLIEVARLGKGSVIFEL